MFNFHDSAKKPDFENKIVFWDLDGTLAPFRFNGHICDPDGSRHSVSLTEIDDGIYFERTPSKFMQKLLSDCNSRENLVITHCHADKEMRDKHKWLDRHFPSIKERFIIDEKISKTDTILTFCKSHNLELSEVVFVDDSLHFLQEAEKLRIPCWHISSLLDYFELE
ncbi:MAG: hypothetical protein J5659_00010 [Clostridia bacterium]|nr:hypothetical protein [Clostridia bacterium]